LLAPERISELCGRSAQKMERLRALVRAQGSAVVAFSAGVDSTFVLKVAVDELGERAVALTALSPSMAPEEQREAEELAKRLGARWIAVQSEEIANPSYAANPENRCYFCKTELYTVCERKRDELGLSAILDGFNADDLRDFRPGRQAALEHRTLSPLAEVGLTKDEIRAWSQRLGLPTWDKPQMACLASRIPYGTAVTSDRLMQIALAESDLRRLGFRIFRVRYHGEVARLEISAGEYPRLQSQELRAEVDRALKARGFRFVAVDLEPFRSGKMNDARKGAGAPGEALPLPVVE